MMNVDIESRDEIRDLYRELILDHAKKPRHFGKLDGATHTAQGINPLCGDKLHLYLRMDDHDMISDAKFEGTGCAISVASASLLTDSVIGLGKNDALQKIEQVTSRLSGSMTAADSTVELGKLRALEGVRDYPSRIKCATLAWHALNSAINKNDSPASTE